jgi:hypothetical protein
MQKHLLVLLLLLVTASSSALAQGVGRAACRLILPQPEVRCFGEQSLLALGPLELAGGLEARYMPPYTAAGLVVVPYLQVAWYEPGRWVQAQVRWHNGIQAALSVGWNWGPGP